MLTSLTFYTDLAFLKKFNFKWWFSLACGSTCAWWLNFTFFASFVCFTFYISFMFLTKFIFIDGLSLAWRAFYPCKLVSVIDSFAFYVGLCVGQFLWFSSSLCGCARQLYGLAFCPSLAFNAGLECSSPLAVILRLLLRSFNFLRFFCFMSSSASSVSSQQMLQVLHILWLLYLFGQAVLFDEPDEHNILSLLAGPITFGHI